MMTACNDDVRVADEPVGLPPLDVAVFACTIRRRPMDSDAIHAAFADAGLGKLRGTVNPVAGEFLATGRPLPAEVLALLEESGHKQEFSRSARVEMRRIDPATRQKGQHVGEGGWVCDAMPLGVEYDLVPTHWELASEVGLG